MSKIYRIRSLYWTENGTVPNAESVEQGAKYYIVKTGKKYQWNITYDEYYSGNYSKSGIEDSIEKCKEACQKDYNFNVERFLEEL